ncbi:HAD-superfamily hydrolase, subfamily IA, variant 3 [Verrucomicrobia bacterium]|nr:HAD-superfamily hydrolase, subfamily IA, variant 3 [Verrucomicrobiota bacterium]
MNLAQPATMPKAVVFDLGKVLVDFDYGLAARKLAARSKMAPQEVLSFFGQSPLLFRYETGLLSNEEFFREVCTATGYRGGFEEFGEGFGDIFNPIPAMVELQTALRRRFPTYIFSNTNDLAIRYLRRTYPFMGNFDGYILSYEQRAMKPGAKIYEAVERQTGRRGADILYLDDRPENIATGAERGWQVLLQESPEKTQAAIRKLGLLNE